MYLRDTICTFLGKRMYRQGVDVWPSPQQQRIAQVGTVSFSEGAYKNVKQGVVKGQTYTPTHPVPSAPISLCRLHHTRQSGSPQLPPLERNELSRQYSSGLCRGLLSMFSISIVLLCCYLRSTLQTHTKTHGHHLIPKPHSGLERGVIKIEIQIFFVGMSRILEMMVETTVYCATSFGLMTLQVHTHTHTRGKHKCQENRTLDVHYLFLLAEKEQSVKFIQLLLLKSEKERSQKGPPQPERKHLGWNPEIRFITIQTEP